MAHAAAHTPLITHPIQHSVLRCASGDTGPPGKPRTVSDVVVDLGDLAVGAGNAHLRASWRNHTNLFLPFFTCLNDSAMKLKDASKATTAELKQQQKGSTIAKQRAAALSNDLATEYDTNVKAKDARQQQEQPQQASQLGQEQQAGSLSMQPDPLLLVALHVSYCFSACWLMPPLL